MPAATVPGFLYDAFSRPAIWQGSPGVLHKRTRDDDRLRPKAENHFDDYRALLSPDRYTELVSECRARGSRGFVSALLENKMEYVTASGFRPRFVGSDTAWGVKAQAAIDDALKVCSLRGARFNWRACWRLAVPTRATDGRFFILLSQWESGWPALQFLEGHRIGQRKMAATVVGPDDAFTVTEGGGAVRGAYSGLSIQNGVITNRVGTEVAFRVLGPTPDDDQDISARDIIQVATPQRYSEGCPVPDIARALMDFIALDVAQTCQLDQQIADSKMTFLETTETGRADPAAELAGMGRGTTKDGTPTEMVERGHWRYLKSGSGDLKAFESDRPSDQWLKFDARVTSRAAAACRWRAEMLDPKELGGVAGRAFQDQINTLIMDEFSTLEPAAVRVLGYFAAKLIGLGVIPNSPEWMRWSVAPPPWFEVDRASSRLDIEDVAAGRTPMSVLHGRDGHTSEEVYTDRAVSYQKALAIHKRFPDVPLEVILGDLGLTAARTGIYPDPSAIQTDTDGPSVQAAPSDTSEREDAKALLMRALATRLQANL